MATLCLASLFLILCTFVFTRIISHRVHLISVLVIFCYNYDALPQDRRIRGLLEGCTLEHDARMDALHGRVRERVQSDARWKQLQRESNKAVCELSENYLYSSIQQNVFALIVKAIVEVP